jgi:HAD superfamily hydrolase (TIGR01484 family)
MKAKKSRSLFNGMVVTDLDGTLLHAGESISSVDLDTLSHLGSRGILRVIATGRSLYSACKVLPPETPIDYLIFSSGMGTVEWRSQKIVNKYFMTQSEVERAVSLLLSMNLDFMVHDPIPENHRFRYFGNGKNNPDFIRRLNIYREFATRSDPENYSFGSASHIVAVEPADGESSSYKKIHRELNLLSIIRTTSPIDGKSTWIEILPGAVSKAAAAQWVFDRCSPHNSNVLAVGNDYNDLDLLSWAAQPFVVDNAPDDLRRKFPTVGSCLENGFTEAVERWLQNQG